MATRIQSLSRVSSSCLGGLVYFFQGSVKAFLCGALYVYVCLCVCVFVCVCVFFDGCYRASGFEDLIYVLGCVALGFKLQQLKELMFKA